MESFAERLRSRSAGLRVLHLGGGDADTHTATGSMDFTVMAARAPMELEIKRRTACMDLGVRCPTVIDSPFRKVLWLIEAGESAAQVARDLGMSRATLCRCIRGLPVPTI